MLKENGLNKNVPRVEYDHRAREARRRFERLEQRLVNRDAVVAFRMFRLLRLLGASVAGGRKGDDSTGSPGDQRPCDIPMFLAPQVA